MSIINKTIGKVKCPFTGAIAEVRKNKKGKLYFYSPAGMITPNLEAGQDWLLNNAQLFNQEEVETVNENEAVLGRRMYVNEKLKAEQEDSGWTLI